MDLKKAVMFGLMLFCLTGCSKAVDNERIEQGATEVAATDNTSDEQDTKTDMSSSSEVTTEKTDTENTDPAETTEGVGPTPTPVSEPENDIVIETPEDNTPADADLRGVAESYVGKSASLLTEEIGDCLNIHPAGNMENGKYRGYLHYDGFEVEFESDNEDYLERGDLSGCTVTAVVDSLFD